MNNLGIKPNYAAFCSEYGMDWRTVKKYDNGYDLIHKKYDKENIYQYLDLIAEGKQTTVDASSNTK